MTLCACDCVVSALVVLAPPRRTEPGHFFYCDSHRQMVVWDGHRWRWSNQPEDIQELLRMADPAKADAV
ncbi:hypothetical protein [Streptomyces sp. NPDC057002]|uniref:hypothetical protein n=1 Tax=Streptomyces sp. NPDC057002 TaxID=3345992 RepID=UPI00362DB297